MSDIQTWWAHKNHLYPARVHPNQKRIMFYDDHIAEVEKLQARIDDLELIISGKTFSFPTVAEMNKCKAEGIRGMLESVAQTDDGRYMMLVKLKRIIEYANQLEKGDE